MAVWGQGNDDELATLSSKDASCLGMMKEELDGKESETHQQINKCLPCSSCFDQA